MIFDNNIFLKSNKSVNLDLVFDNKNLQNGGTKNKEGKTQETSKNNAVFKQLVDYHFSSSQVRQNTKKLDQFFKFSETIGRARNKKNN